MARDVDTSRACCDTCGEPYRPGDALYSIASKYDEDVTDRDVLVSFRHQKCHTPMDKAIDNLRDASKRAEDALAKLRRLGL